MKRIILLTMLVFFGLSAGAAYPYWIWTPKTNKFVNPKSEVKPTPKEQFDFAKGFYDQKKYEDAKREFARLVKSYPKSFEAAEGQYYLGLSEEAEGNLYEAFLAYQKVIDKYPFSERIQEIIEREYKIGESFMGGYKRKAMGVPLPVENPAIEVFTKVVEDSTYGPLAAKSQYKLGLVLKSLVRYYEAEEAFNKVVTNYPDSEWAAAAKFQIASCRAAVSRGPEYDQGSAKEARDQFEAFVKDHPDAVLSQEAEKNIEQLQEKEAEGNFNIAKFYEKQGKYNSATVYYQDIIDRYPDSPWAAKSAEKLKALEDKGKKKR